MTCSLVDTIRSALGHRLDTFEGRTFVCVALCDIHIVSCEILIVFAVCRRAVNQLDKGFACSLGRVFQNSDCFCYRFASDDVENDADLEGRDSDEFSRCTRSCIRFCLTVQGFLFTSCCHIFLLLLRGLCARVTSERTRRCKFAEFATDHIFRDIYGDVLLTVVNCDRVTDHFGENRGTSGPSFNGLTFTGRVHRIDSVHKAFFYIRAFFNTSTHFVLRLVHTLNNELIRFVLLLSGLITESRFAPRCDR